MFDELEIINELPPPRLDRAGGGSSWKNNLLPTTHYPLPFMTTGTDVYLTARELVGTPYLHQGRKKDLGIDCIGVPIWTSQKLSLGIVDRFNYSRQPDGTMKDRLESICSFQSLQPGVLLLFKIKSIPQHCGIVSSYMDGLGLIHAWDIAGRVVEHQLTHEWYDRTVGCYGLPKVNYS